MKIGFTSTTLRQIRDTEQIVGIAVRAGAEIIEWGGDIHVKNIQDAAKAKAACDSAGIAISSYGSYYRVGSGKQEDRLRICETAARMDCDSIRVWLGLQSSRKTTEDAYKKIKEDTVRVCETAAKYGLTVCPECHDNTYNDDTDAFLQLKKETACENLRTYFQSRYRKKAYDLDRIERTLPYIESVHLSFSEQVREQFPHSDKTYMDTLLRKLLSCGFDGNILLEYTYPCQHWGIPSMLCKDIGKIREKAAQLL